jgi:hypothetical protein
MWSWGDVEIGRCGDMEIPMHREDKSRLCQPPRPRLRCLKKASGTKEEARQIRLTINHCACSELVELHL